MFKFFDFIVSLVDTIWSLFSGAFQYVVTLCSFIMSGFNFYGKVMQALPPFAYGFLACVIGIAAASLFIGHLIDL